MKFFLLKSKLNHFLTIEKEWKILHLSHQPLIFFLVILVERDVDTVVLYSLRLPFFTLQWIVVDNSLKKRIQEIIQRQI